MSSRRLVVCGGNGFLGSRICRSAVSRGWDVTSLSRSGEPRWSPVTSSSSAPDWARKVSWERADIFEPVQYRSLLRGADYVVHSMGILLEANYKGFLSGKESPLAALQRAASSAGAASPNPLRRTRQGAGEQEQTAGGGEKPRSLTYEAMNRDSAVLLAREAADAGARAFGYVSAAAGAPVLPSRYITTKREAESAIASGFPRMRSVFIRPPLLYDSSRAITLPLAGLAFAGSLVNSLTGGVLGRTLGLGSMVDKPLRADAVAEAAVEALSDEQIRGPVDARELEQLAEKAWRKGML